MDAILAKVIWRPADSRRKKSIKQKQSDKNCFVKALAIEYFLALLVIIWL